jgi:MoaA/NifB/PqqE/SkfB family radical SAM enzyme
MKILPIPEPFSGGIFLSYKCTSECRHCMYACSPKWKSDWISVKDLEEVLTQLAAKINKRYPAEFKKIGINYGIHFTGGEPFLNFELLLKAVEIASELEIPAMFVETNCFWCVSDEVTRERLTQLKDAGLHGILVSANPFILEYVPFERTERAVRISKELFGENVIVYQEFFYRQFKILNLKSTLSFGSYLQRTGLESLYYIELIPMGRAPYKLGHLFRKYPAERFFGDSCREELTRSWHVHVDNYCNYITGYCAGISLGDARNLDSICREGVDLDKHPIIKALVMDVKELYKIAIEFDYKELPNGYISKCHLCMDIRRHIVQRTSEFEELRPKEFYDHLE